MGCGEPTNASSAEFCLNQQQRCLDDHSHQAELSLQRPLQIEYPITFMVTLPQGLSLRESRAQLVGVNMQMGRLPIELSAQGDERYAGTLMVVACSDPDMIWQLQIETLSAAGQSETLHWSFSTQILEL